MVRKTKNIIVKKGEREREEEGWKDRENLEKSNLVLGYRFPLLKTNLSDMYLSPSSKNLWESVIGFNGECVRK